MNDIKKLNRMFKLCNYFLKHGNDPEPLVHNKSGLDPSKSKNKLPEDVF